MLAFSPGELLDVIKAAAVYEAIKDSDCHKDINEYCKKNCLAQIFMHGL